MYLLGYIGMYIGLFLPLISMGGANIVSPDNLIVSTLISTVICTSIGITCANYI